jgi:hypothetical protein
MNSLNVRAGIVVALSLLFAFAARASAADEPPFFPIMAWNHAPGDPAVLKKMHECGITVAGFVYAKDLDAVHAAGMKGIVTDPRVGGYDWANVDADVARKNVTALIAEVGNHPAVFGYYLRDEPPVPHFAGLEKVASVVRELAPGKWPYINLLPIYADAGQLGTADYAQYLAKFVETCRPPILSYDNYSLLDNGALRDGYWTNLEHMREAAVKAKIPFWNIVLAVAHFSYREVSLADFRFQAYTTLAYGGRGISYFTYFAPQVGNYRMAPIDQFGNTTPTWYSMQNVNLQILKLAPTLLQLTSDRVYHFGEVPKGCSGVTDASLLKGADNDFMAGDFTHADGSKWVMIVNRDVLKSRHCNPQFRTPPKKVRMLSPYTGQLLDFEGEQRFLAPGQGVLLKLE